MALCKGVPCSLSRAFTSVPLSMRNLTAQARPLKAALCKGMHPSRSFSSILAPDLFIFVSHSLAKNKFTFFNQHLHDLRVTHEGRFMKRSSSFDIFNVHINVRLRQEEFDHRRLV